MQNHLHEVMLYKRLRERRVWFVYKTREPYCLPTFYVNIQLTTTVSASVYVPSLSYYDNMIISLAWPDLFRRRTQDYITCNINRHKFTTYWDTLKHTVYTKPISSFQGCISVVKSIIRAIRVTTEFAIVKVCGCKFMDLYSCILFHSQSQIGYLQSKLIYGCIYLHIIQSVLLVVKRRQSSFFEYRETGTATF